MRTPRADVLDSIRRCLDADRFRVLPHFMIRMHERGLVWADVLAVVDASPNLEADGHDDWGRDRWIIRGPGADGSVFGLVCVLGLDADGQIVVFVTAFWE